jgi:predicted RNase H-like nuclease
VAESEILVAGLDGCRSGWVMATVPLGATGPLRLELVDDPVDVVRRLEAGTLAAAAIDIPIGLATGTPRRCDVEARRLLGARRSSVFPAPARSVLGAASYEEACARSALACGKKISRQLFNILPKIQQVDALVTPQCQARLFEMCPELSFAVLAGAPMCANKRTAAGRAERATALEAVFDDVGPLVRRPPPGAAPDDVLDALIGVWTARRHANQAHVRLGGELDATGLRMEVIA